MDLRDKAAFVTGGARRVGREIAIALARAGCHVGVHHRGSGAAAEATADEIRTLGRKAVSIRADQRASGQVEEALHAAERALGPLTILVAAASVFRGSPVLETTEAEWDLHLDTNLKGPFLWSTALARRITAREGEGVFIHIACTSALSPWTGYLAYSVSKAGIVSLTRGLAKALAPRIRVNAVLPGPVLPPEGSSEEESQRLADTTLLGRIGNPVDVARAVTYLAAADYATGTIIAVDGGRSLR